MTNKRLNNPELVRFIKKYGKEAHNGSRTRIDKELDWFLSKKRLFLTREKKTKTVLALVSFIIVDDIKNLSWEKWPEDKPNGIYVFVPYIVLHPKIKFKGFMQKISKAVLKLYPKLKYLIFFRRDNLRVNSITRFLKKETCHGIFTT